MKIALTTAAALFTATAASGAIVNAGFEDGDNPGSGGISTAGTDSWGPSGEDFLHSVASEPGNAGLGTQFAFYSNNLGQAVYQVLSDTVAADTLYTFGFAINDGGAQPDEVAGFFIGAVDASDIPVGTGIGAGANNLTDLQAAGITILASAEVVPSVNWTTDSIASTAAAPGGVVGQQLVIGLYNTQSGNGGSANDIWFDEFSLTSGPVPEPGSLALLGLGGLALLRRRR